MIKSDAVRGSSRWALALMVALAVAHPGCGKSNAGPEVFSDSRTVAVLDNFGVVFTAQRNGTVDVDVNWTNSANDIDIYVASGTCATLDILLGGGCNVIAFSESATAKPETATFSATNGTTYSIFARHIGPGTDTITIRLTAR